MKIRLRKKIKKEFKQGDLVWYKGLKVRLLGCWVLGNVKLWEAWDPTYLRQFYINEDCLEPVLDIDEYIYYGEQPFKREEKK